MMAAWVFKKILGEFEPHAGPCGSAAPQPCASLATTVEGLLDYAKRWGRNPLAIDHPVRGINGRAHMGRKQIKTGSRGRPRITFGSGKGYGRT